MMTLTPVDTPDPAVRNLSIQRSIRWILPAMEPAPGRAAWSRQIRRGRHARGAPDFRRSSASCSSIDEGCSRQSAGGSRPSRAELPPGPVNRIPLIRLTAPATTMTPFTALRIGASVGGLSGSREASRREHRSIERRAWSTPPQGPRARRLATRGKMNAHGRR